MNCTRCGAEMRIIKSVLRVEGDTSPDETTRVIRAQTLKCLNTMCDRPDEVVVEHEEPIG